LGCSLVILSGCATTTRGPQPILSSQGLAGGSSANAQGVVAQFIAAEKVAHDDAQKEAATPGSVGTDQLNKSSRAMLESGFVLVYANCSDFFTSAGTTQKWLTVSRDTVGVMGTLATSALALHNGGHMAISNLALGTAIAFAGLDLYTKDFLFSAENTDAVRTLVTTALNTHQHAVETIGGNATYGTVTEALLDHQDICSPPAITALVRAAIKNGTVETSPDPASELTKLGQAQDSKALADLGVLFNPPGALSIDQAHAVWQMAKISLQPDNRAQIFASLTKSGIPESNLPIDSKGNFVASKWTSQRSADVNQALDRFSDATKTSLNTPLPASSAPPKAAANVPPSTPGTSFIPAAPAPASYVRSLHVTVRIASPKS